MSRTEVAHELAEHLAVLSTPNLVFVASGCFAEPDADMPELAAEIGAVIERLMDDHWKDHVWPRPRPGEYSGIRHAVRIAGSLEPLDDRAAAVESMAELAAVDLVWSPAEIMDRDVARDAAARVVTLLGPDATWWTNRVADDGSVNGVTPCTFDGLIAGTDGTHFAILIQVGED
ncbi:hypothetical protein [Embleya scabrispora]|uniref:hypothetical protein n=1 Tax=Embleya scabrispora TaxID=159449 RepID=UPI00037EFFC2|nr:hypothetical protein [Embleya scabrispora]MYS80627.1 hypothetical protein [Streptomyces sp. SID5474]